MNMLDKAKAYGNTAINTGKLMVGALQQQNMRRRLDGFNAEIEADKRRKAAEEAARLQAVSDSVRAGSAERTAAPVMARRPAPAMTLGNNAVPTVQQVDPAERERLMRAQEERILRGG